MIIRFLLIFLFSFPAFAIEEFQHGISTFGDLKYSKNFKHFEYVNPNAPKNGEMVLGVEGTFNNLNKFILKGVSASGLDYLYDSLMESSADEISTLYGLVAKSVRLEPDRKSIEFRLRKEARFHDGKAITADDVIFTFNILTTKGHPAYKMAFRDVKKVKKINSHQVKFIFKNNKNRDLPTLVASLPILPKHYYKNNDFEKTTLKAPLGSGPYKIKEVKPNRTIIYERVKNYWAKDLPVNRGRYNFDQITFDYYRDSNVLVEAFKSQKYDFRQENIARNWATSYNIDAVKNGEIIKEEIKHSLPAPMQAFILNLRKEKFQDIAFRKALTYAFDFQWLKKHIFYGSYKRTKSYFANSIFGFESFALPESDGDGFNRKNLIKAKEILEEGGYKIIDQKLIDPKTNKPVSIEFLIVSESFKMVLAPFVNSLKRLGIDAKVRFTEENQYQTRMNNFDFDIVVAVYGQALIPGNELFAYFHSSQKDIKGGRNLSGLDNKKVDKLIAKILSANSKSDLKEYCRKLDKILLENYYLIPQWHNNSYRIIYRDIFKSPDVKPKYSLAIDSWWVLNDGKAEK